MIGLFEIKPIIEKLSENNEFGEKFLVSPGFWHKAVEIIEVLKVLYIATVESQKVGYSLSDFYISWLRIRKGLQRCHQSATLNFCSTLLSTLEDRTSTLLNTPLMLCSIYLDPRINFKLNLSQKRNAALSLKEMYTRLEKLLWPSDCNVINDTLDEICAEDCRNSNEQRDINETVFISALSDFENEKPSDIHASVMSFWSIHGNKYPKIKPLAEILHSIPANQCCVERSFSGFSYIRSVHRKSMGAKNMKNVLLVRLNKDLYYQYRKETIENIKNR